MTQIENRVPVSGAFAKVFYDFETQFLVYPNSTSTDYYLDIDNILGQGVKVSKWTKNHNVQVVTGLNNIEAGATTDGVLANDMTIEFYMTGDINWMKSIMGKKIESEDILTFTKGGTPKSMRWVIYIQNDATNELAGDLYILKGVIIKSLDIEAQVGSNGAISVRMEVAYATEEAKGVWDIPPDDAYTEEVFNFGEGVAYFWAPGTSAASPASFNSLETIVDKLRLTISHEASMVTGISSVISKNRWYGPLLYTMDVDVVYQEREKFLEKFYGCADGPIDGNTSPFKRVLVVFQNTKFCGEAFRRIEFEFNVVKMSTYDMMLDAEDRILEKVTTNPLNCIIRMYDGAEPDYEFSVSPSHIKEGQSIIIKAMHFPPNTDVKIYIDAKTTVGLLSTVKANCTGAAEVMLQATGSLWGIGKHTIYAVGWDGTTEVDESQDVYVTSTDGSVPKIVLCPMYDAAGSVGPIQVTGYGFGISGEISTITLNFGKSGQTPLWSVNPTVSANASVFEYTTTTQTLDAGIYTAEATATLTGGTGINYGAAYLYVTDITKTGSSGNYTLIAYGLKPYERCNFFIGGAYQPVEDDEQYIGASIPDSSGTARLTSTFAGTGTYVVKVTQPILSDNFTITAEKSIVF